MQETISTAAPVKGGWLAAFISRARAGAPSLAEWGAAIVTSLLLVLSFPDFNLWPLAWVGLVPMMAAIAYRPNQWRAFLMGWLSGALFFYLSCYWLTFSMIHYGGLPAWISYLLLVPGALVLGLFPGSFALLLSRAIKRWGVRALLLAPFIWSAFEWLRLAITGQLWNALGYSQAYQPLLIQSARWGGVYLIGFLIVSVNAVGALLVIQRSAAATAMALSVIAGVALLLGASYATARRPLSPHENGDAVVIALQPNVPMDLDKSNEELQSLALRHLEMTRNAITQLPENSIPRLIIWPESPMNFTYGSDSQFREIVGSFARENKASILFNSQELAAPRGIYNSAVLVNEKGRLIAQYDKIRLLPFGEYVPLPHWLPGASSIRAIVGDFTPGANYTLMPAGAARAGVFICIESAYPSIARTFTAEGADVLINISNDGYLGRTAVMHQHLANAVFRAVENGRPLLRVTNTGISAYITPRGEVEDATGGFETAVRTWSLSRNQNGETLYTQHGDLFALGCVLFALIVFSASFIGARGALRITR